MEKWVEAIDMDSDESLSFDNVERLKRMVKLIVSVCVFSLVLALFFSSFSVFPHSFSVYFSTFLFSVLNHAMERKYMFLLCNGILFFVATSSVIEHSSSSSSSSFGTYSFSHFEHDVVAASDGSDSEEEQKNQEEEKEEEEKEEVCRGEFEEELEDEGCFTEEEEEEEEDEERKRRELEVLVSTEELNFKIEEFIRRMKQEMRIEAAQTHLIAV